MSSEIVGFQMDPNHLPCFVHNLSPGRIGYRKYPLFKPNPFPAYVFLETVRNFLRCGHPQAEGRPAPRGLNQ